MNKKNLYNVFLYTLFLGIPMAINAIAPSDQSFENGGPALLSNPVNFDGVEYSHNLPLSGKMARYNDSVDGRDRFGITDSSNSDNVLLYHIADSGSIDAPSGDIDFRFKSVSGDEFKLISMEAGSITDFISVSKDPNHIVTITGYRDGVSITNDIIDFTQSDSNGSVTYSKNTSYNDGLLTFDNSWGNIDEVRFTTSGITSKVTFVAIDAIDFDTFSIPSDSDATLTSSATVIEPVSLSTTIDTVGESVNLFDFTITDGGGGDTLSTDITQIVLNTSGTGDFSKVTWRLNGNDASNVTGVYNSSANTITFSGLNISIADGSNETYTINGYFNNNTGVIEGQTFILSVDGDTDLVLDGSKTQMSGSNSAVTNAGGTTINVTATGLSFSTQPAGSVSGSNLTTQPVVKAVDAFGNVDTDFTETVTLTEASVGTLSGGSVAASSGVATFTAVNYTATADQQSFTLTANDQDGVGSNLSTVDSNAVTSDVVATKLMFTTEPIPLTVQSGVSTSLSTVPVVRAVDGNNTIDTGYSTGITLSEVNGAGSATMTATGDTDGDGSTVSITPSSGVSTFTSMQLTYTASGSSSETFNLQASSGSLSTAISSQMIGTTNQAPTFTSFSTFIDTVNEDTEVEITLTELKAQGDESDSDGTVDAFVVQAVSTGTLKIGASSGTATAYASGTNDTIDSTNKAYWTPAQDANGTLNAFTLKAKDDKNSLSSTAVQGQVSVTAVNDTPTLTLPSTPSINEDASNYAIENTINVADVDDDNLTVTITATNGTISVNTSSVGSFITGDGTDDGVIKFTETVANVNTVLDSLTFSPTKDFDGTASVKVDIDDSTASVVSDTLSITVKNAPEITSITRGNPVSEKTNADSLVFNVNISDQGTTTGADTTDFQVTGGSTAVVSNVTRQSVYYEVTVSGGDLASYSGTVGLNFIDNNSMTDNGVPIGGDGVDSFTTGETYTLDNTAPNAPLAVDLITSSDTGSLNNDNATNDTTPTFTGTAEANSTITLISSIDGTIGTTTADGSGNWSIAASTLSAGNHNITVTATDSVGNTSSASIALVVTIDNTTPTIVVSPSKSTAINGEVIDLTFTLSEESSDFIVDDISVVGGSLSEFTQSTSNTKVYTAKLTIDDTTTTQATIDVNASKFTDSVGNANSAATQKAITIFPSVVKLTPTKDSTDAALNSDLKIEFSEEVVKGTTGSINIYKTSDDGLVETIDINDSKITIENPNSTNGLTNTTVTIAKATQLDLVTGYYVTISNTAFKDVSGNLFEGILDKTTWAFTTIDNQAPTISNNSSNATATISVDENQTAVVDIDATDPDLGQTLTYSISGTDASSFDIDSTTGVITFKTAPDYETKSSYSVTVKASDDSTVSLSDTQALTVNINDVNEAPTSSNNSFTINEDTTKTFASTDFAFNDVDNANTLNSIKIVTLPSKGTLQLNSSDVVVNQSILKADISKLTYTPVANENGSSYSSFTFKVNDGNLDSTSAYTMTVNVTAVDDAPEITTTLGNQTQVEDGQGLVISLATSDIDSDASTATYAVTSSDENIATAYIRDGKLIVVPQKNANGNVTIILTSTVGGKSTTKKFTYTLTGVNDAPTISSIDDITHEQTSSVINKTITFDIWDDVEVTSLSATSSNQNLLANSSIVIPSVPYGSQSTLTYTISENNAGKADITITAKDAQGLSYSESFKITVESQSDAQCVENAKTALIFDTIKLNNSFQNALNSNLDLVTDISSVCDATISWETTDSNVVDTNGAVTQGSDNKTIMLTANITKGEFSTNKEFLVTVLPSTVSASEALSKLTFETIKEQNSSKATIISKLNLPTSILGEDIIWTSSDDSVISPYSGYVTRNTTEDKEVTLTATIGSESKTFALTVLKEETSDLNSVTKDTQLLTIESLLGENTDKNSIIYNLAKPLPTTGANGSTISWSSSNTAFITNEGDVLRDANANKTVVLTATITKGSETTTKEFTFQVLQNKIETASSNTFVNAGTTTNGTQVSTSANSQTTQTFSTFASTILNTVDTIVSQGSIRSIVEVAEKIVNVYLNTDGTTKSTLQSTTGSASLENKNVGSTTNVEDDGDIVSSNSDNTIRLKLNNDGTVTHEVVNNTVSKTSTATSKVANSSVRSDESGNVETTSEVKKDGYIYKAVVSTNATGETTTKFVRVDLSTGEQSNVDSTVSSSTPFQAGNEVTITKDDDGNLYIKTTTPLDGNLEIE